MYLYGCQHCVGYILTGGGLLLILETFLAAVTSIPPDDCNAYDKLLSYL